MFETLFASLKADNTNEPPAMRRKYSRRASDRCISEIGGKLYPVENWSLGGFLIHGDERLFSMNSHIEMTMKFRLRDKILDVPHKAQVVRKSRNRIAFEFEPLTRPMRSMFQNVVDDHMATEFADSQIA